MPDTHKFKDVRYVMELTDMHVCLVKCEKECRELLHLMKEVSVLLSLRLSNG